MTKRVFNKFDPFMPVKMSESKLESGVTNNEVDELFESFNAPTLNESLKLGTPQIKNGFITLITKRSIGAENGLGEKLLEDFIFALSNSFELPQYIIFMNEAIFLLDSEKIEHYISNLKKYGVKFLVSLESLSYFKYKVRNKYVIQATSGDIAEKILFSKQVVTF